MTFKALPQFVINILCIAFYEGQISFKALPQVCSQKKKKTVSRHLVIKITAYF
jgi:hypothetical protein